MAGKLEQQIKKKRAFDSPQQAVVVGLMRTNDQFQYRRNRLLREFQLTPAQYNILRILRGEGKPLPCLEIADRMITPVPAITGIVDRLEEGKFVKKERSSKDRRVWNVSVTAAGKKLLAELDKPVQELEIGLCRGLTKRDCRQLEELLEKAREGLSQREEA